MATVAHELTYEEWLKLPEPQDCIEEVVNGELRSVPPNKKPHVDVVQRLLRMFLQLLNPDEVAVLATNFGLVIRERPLTARVPDLALVREETAVWIDGYLHSPPGLVVEVLSPANTRKEREGKLADYESIGVPEVWVLSPEARTVEVLQLEEARLVSSALLNSGQLAPQDFPEAKIEVRRLWGK